MRLAGMTSAEIKRAERAVGLMLIGVCEYKQGAVFVDI